MSFQTVKAAIVQLLGDDAAGRFRSIGYQLQGDSTDENLDNLRSVRVYYASGDFPKSGASTTSYLRHNIAINFEFTVAKMVEIDLAVIDDPLSTPVEFAAAITAAKNAEELADASMDELFEIVFQIIMDARNVDLGLAENVGSRWFAGFQKGEPVPRGQHVTLSGHGRFTCNMQEEISGDTGTTGNIYDTVVDLEGDDVEKTGVLTDNS